MIDYHKIYSFLKKYCHSSDPLLLALSGGSDSIYLFHCLLKYRKENGLAFHVAHVDHGWRKESCQEAEILKALTESHQVPFHLKNLNPLNSKSNLESVCRDLRYEFFANLNQIHTYQAILTGHHRDDLAETVLKRLLEGSHWSKWKGLEEECWMGSMRVLRPLLLLSKKKIQESLSKASIVYFEDPTNKDLKFLRARLREKLIPWCNETFGKNIEKNLISIAEEAKEVEAYFNERLIAEIENEIIVTSWGLFIDLEKKSFHSLIEFKYILRFLSSKLNFFLSREILKQAAQALFTHQCNKVFIMREYEVRIDRQKIFFKKIDSTK